jgi:hypothetical protein
MCMCVCVCVCVCVCEREREREREKETGFNIISAIVLCDRLCGLVVRVPGYRTRGPDFLSSSGSETGSTQPREYN